MASSDFDPNTYPGSPSVEVWTGYLAALVGFVVFLSLNVLAVLAGPPGYMKGEVWRWRNTLISWFHAVMLGLAVLYGLAYRPVLQVDMILYCEPYLYLIVAFSLGYFVFDFLDHAVNGKMCGNYEVILHHLGVIWSFWYNIHYRVNIPYTIIALMVEVNSIFLHGRKIMQFHQWPFHHWLYKLVVVLNLVTFVQFRLYGVYLVGRGVYTEWHRMTVVYQVFIVITMFVMYLINPILFWRLFKNDFWRNLPSGYTGAHCTLQETRNGTHNGRAKIK